MHWLFASQQPVGQDDASHTQVEFVQRCPAAHGPPLPQAQPPAPLQRLADWMSQLAQAPPRRPHVGKPIGLQRPCASQHPVGQLCASHPHAPFAQRWPA
jgi:hypothetical protein